MITSRGCSGVGDPLTFFALIFYKGIEKGEKREKVERNIDKYKFIAPQPPGSF